MVQFHKRVKNSRQKWYHFRKGSNILNKNGTILVIKWSKFLNKNGTISGKGHKSSTKMVPFQKRVKNSRQKWYHFQKKGQNSSTKMVPFQKRVKIPQQKLYYFKKKGQTSSTKMVPFQKWVKIVNENGTILVRKGSKLLDKNGNFRKRSKILNKNSTISEKGQKSSTEMLPFQKWSIFLNKMVPFQAVKGQNSSTKMEPFQKRVKNSRQKWYHFRKGSKLLNKIEPF